MNISIYLTRRRGTSVRGNYFERDGSSGVALQSTKWIRFRFDAFSAPLFFRAARPLFNLLRKGITFPMEWLWRSIQFYSYWDRSIFLPDLRSPASVRRRGLLQIFLQLYERRNVLRAEELCWAHASSAQLSIRYNVNFSGGAKANASGFRRIGVLHSPVGEAETRIAFSCGGLRLGFRPVGMATYEHSLQLIHCLVLNGLAIYLSDFVSDVERRLSMYHSAVHDAGHDASPVLGHLQCNSLQAETIASDKSWDLSGGPFSANRIYDRV